MKLVQPMEEVRVKGLQVYKSLHLLRIKHPKKLQVYFHLRFVSGLTDLVLLVSYLE